MREIGHENAVRGQSIDFLGYTFTHERVLLRKSIKKRFIVSNKIKDAERRRRVLSSYWGWCKHGNCKNLWRKTTDMSFAEKGIKRSNQTKDGKRFFEVEEKRMMDIINVPIIIHDCIDGVKTRMGDGRFCILFEQDGKRYKVITNSFKIKDILGQAMKMENAGEKIFPTSCIIRRKALNEGKSDYYFDE